jgi:hypothetical protein
MLGYDYSIEGKVVHGYKIGRNLGFPTANIKPSNNKLIPPEGVYAVRCEVDDLIYKGVLSIGKRETLEKISRLPKIKPLLLAAAAEENPSILERLVLSRKIKQEALKILNTPSPKEVNEISLKKLYLECGELGKSVLLLKNKEAVVLWEKIEKEKGFINKEDLDFSGEEMQRLGVFGKEIAKVRDKILNGIITGELQNCKEEIEKYILEKGLDRSRK